MALTLLAGLFLWLSGCSFGLSRDADEEGRVICVWASGGLGLTAVICLAIGFTVGI